MYVNSHLAPRNSSYHIAAASHSVMAKAEGSFYAELFVRAGIVSISGMLFFGAILETFGGGSLCGKEGPQDCAARLLAWVILLMLGTGVYLQDRTNKARAAPATTGKVIMVRGVPKSISKATAASINSLKNEMAKSVVDLTMRSIQARDARNTQDEAARKEDLKLAFEAIRSIEQDGVEQVVEVARHMK